MPITGGKKKTRPHGTLTNANSEVLYRRNNILLTTSVYCWHKFLNWYKTHSWMLKNNNKLLAEKKTLSVSEGVQLNTLKLFSAKCFNIFLHYPWKIILEPIQYFYANNALILLQKCNLSFKAPKNQHAFFIFLKKVLVCSIRHLHTHRKFFSEKYFIIFFNVQGKCVLYQFKYFILTIHRCCHKILFISVKDFRTWISKSFMRPRFFLPTFNIKLLNFVIN